MRYILYKILSLSLPQISQQRVMHFEIIRNYLVIIKIFIQNVKQF